MTRTSLTCRAVLHLFLRLLLHLSASSTGRFDPNRCLKLPGLQAKHFSYLPVELVDRCRNRREELPNCPARTRSIRQICRLISQVGAGTAKGNVELPGTQVSPQKRQDPLQASAPPLGPSGGAERPWKPEAREAVDASGGADAPEALTGLRLVFPELPASTC